MLPDVPAVFFLHAAANFNPVSGAYCARINM